MLDSGPDSTPDLRLSESAAPHQRHDSAASRLLRAFRHRNYRLFFAGQIVSLVGTFLSQVAVSWLVYRVTKQAGVVGVGGFDRHSPRFLLAAIRRVGVGRWGRRPLLGLPPTLVSGQT